MKEVFILCMALLVGRTVAFETIWKNCTDGFCFHLLEPRHSLDELRDDCSQLGGSLFSVRTLAYIEHLQNVHEHLDPIKASAKLLLGGQFPDGPGDETFEFDNGELINQTVFDNFASTLRNDGGKCVTSHLVNGGISWERVSCASLNASYTSFCQHATPEYGFCYEIRWQDEENRVRKRVLEPVVKFPKDHPKVKNNGVCGQWGLGFIPPSGFWSEDGAQDRSDPTCKELSGGELFYAYDYPTAASSNTGFSEDDALSMFFLVDTDYKGYWVLTIDKPKGKANEGMVELYVNSSGVAGQNTTVLLKDDRQTIAETTHCTLEAVKQQTSYDDCYAWNSQVGSGNFLWRWKQCCTDGMVLGRLPSSDFQFDVQVVAKDNINKLLIGDYNHEKNDIEMSKIPLTSMVSVVGYTCPDFCKQITNCGECSMTKGCGWCPGNGCEPMGAKGGCTDGWKDLESETCCEECVGINDCLSCVDVPGCGWDWSTGSCSAGNKYSRIMCKADNLIDHYFAFDTKECTTKAPTRSPLNPGETHSPTFIPTLKPSNAPSTSPTIAPSGSPTKAPSHRPTDSPTRRPTESPTMEPTHIPSESPSKTPTTNESAITDGITTANGESGSDGDGAWIAWGIPLILLLLLAMCCGLLAFILKRRRDEDDENEEIGPPIEVDKSPVEAELSLNDITLDERSKIPVHQRSNDLVEALLTKHRNQDFIRVFTNNPAIAEKLFSKSNAFVKCTEDNGALIDKLSANNWGWLAGLSFGGKSSPKIRTDFKVKKKDEWTTHVDPSTNEKYYYNGKHNKIAWTEEHKDIKKTARHDPLRWEFAPDEFDDFDAFVLVLRKDDWKAQHDLHITYYVNNITKERIWIE